MYFDSNSKHNIWIHPVTKEGNPPDHFLILQNQLQKVIKVKYKFDGAPSDHAALMITYNLKSSKLFPSKLKSKITKKNKKIDNAYLRTSRNAQFEEKVINFLDTLKENEIDENQMTSEQILLMLEKHIVKLAKETSEKEIKHHPDWFSQSEHLLSFHIELRN